MSAAEVSERERGELTPSPAFARGRRGAVNIIIGEEDETEPTETASKSSPPDTAPAKLHAGRSLTGREQTGGLSTITEESKNGVSEESGDAEKRVSGPPAENASNTDDEKKKVVKPTAKAIFGRGSKTAGKFKAIVKIVQHNLQWSRPANKPDEDNKAFVVQHSEGGEPKTLTFNASAFKANIQSVQDIGDDAKLLLQVQAWNRTDDDVNFLYSIVKRLKCFDKYPSMVKKELSRVLYYETFEDGRVVVQQGQPGMSFYFILSGTVSVEVMEADRVTGESHRQVIGELGSGASFGELALLHNSKRTATIICKGNCEFLRVDKPDFDMVLRRSHEHRWEKLLSAIKEQAIFKDWPDAEQRAACDRAKLREYNPNTIILSDLKYCPENIYFIVSGKCKIVREYPFLHTQMPANRSKITLPPVDHNQDVAKDFLMSQNERLQRHLLEICTVGRGHYFGVGEDLRKTHIIAVSKVECLLINSVVFSRYDRGKTLDNMKYAAATLLPNRQQTFQMYQDNRLWFAYKKKLINEILEKRRIPKHRHKKRDQILEFGKTKP